MISLALFYTSSFVDRAILNILAESIKQDLGLTDTQLGVLGGIAFAALYAVLGVPVARLAERKNRLAIITVALTIWSAMTMLCAVAVNFWQMAVARAGVGIGEAACTPCAHSMISDSFPAEQRATAISIYSLGIPIGTLLGILGGAWVAEAVSWRAAFVAVGAPGLVLAAIAAFLLREPVRGRFDAAVSETPPPLAQVLGHLWKRRSFRHLLAGVTLSTMTSAGLGAFGAPYLLRSEFGVDLSEVALVMALLVGCASFVGTLVGGPLADHWAKFDPRLALRIPAAAYFIAAPLMALAYATDQFALFVGLSMVGQLAAMIYIGPTFGALHNMVEPRMRATAVAIVFMLTSLVGIGLGPVLIGVISDQAAAWLFQGDWSACSQASTLPACSAASFGGLRIALIGGALIYLWPGIHYFIAGSTLTADLIAPPEGAPAHAH